MPPIVWMRNRPIAVKVFAAVLVGLVALTSVGICGALSLRAVDNRASALYVHGVQPLEKLANLRDLEGDTRWEIRDYALAQNDKDRAEFLAQIKVTDVALDADIAAYLAQGGNGMGERAGEMHEFISRLTAFRQVRDTKVLPAVAGGRTAAAVALVNGPLQQADNAMAGPMDRILSAEDAAAQRQSSAARASYRSALELLLGLLLAGILGATVLGTVVVRSISRPIKSVMTVLEQVSKGDLTGGVEVRSTDEAGRMGVALNTAIATLRTTVSTLHSNAESVSSSSAGLSSVSLSMATSANQVTDQAALVASAAEEISVSSQSVAGAAEEMGSSIREIARSASDAAQVVASAVSCASTAALTIGRLGESSAEIAGVLSLITSIAEQIKLLALNATIEAARAGAAGRGFAVVAGEVKALADETATATEEIAGRIRSIRADSGDAVTAITEIGEVIDRISDHTASIAAAVEQQTLTTAEIARSVAEVAQGSGDIALNISEVAAAAAASSSAVGDNLRASGELAELSAGMAGLVGQFTVA